MKKFHRLLMMIMLTLIISCSSDDDQPQNPIDKLPPATQTGEQTFGCLINGEVFIPDNFGQGRPNAFYQFVRGNYTLGISAYKSDEKTVSIAFAGLDVEPIMEENYVLKNEISGNYYGRYSVNGGLEHLASTSDNHPGTLIITNFDPENYIISGTFEFTVIDNDGKEIRITDGRFDMNYTN